MKKNLNNRYVAGFVMIIVIVLLMIAPAAIIANLSHYFIPKSISYGNRLVIIFLMSTSFGLMLSVAIFSYWGIAMNGLHPVIKLADWLLWIAVTVLILLFVFYLTVTSSYFQNTFWENQVFNSITYWPLAFISFGLLTPIYEELLFRGYMISCLAKLGTPSTLIVLINSLIWSLLHTEYHLVLIIFIFCLGCLFSIMRLLTRSVVLPMVCHVIFNGTQVLVYAFS